MARRLLVATSVLMWSFAFALAPAKAGGGCTDVSAGHSTTVDLKSFCVIPTLIRVTPGSEVTFVNRDPMTHVIVGAGFAWGSEDELAPGESFSATFDRDGVYPFQCYLHPGMSGAVLVGDANGRGAATSTGVTLPAVSNGATIVSPTPAARSAGASADSPWPGAIAAALGLAIVACGVWLGVLRARRPAPARPPAGT
jgi:plastocyanin